jgi:hypothetical protein
MKKSRVLGDTSTNFPLTTLGNDSARESIQDGNSPKFILFITILSQQNIHSPRKLNLTSVVIKMVSLFHFHTFILSKHYL